MSISSSIRDLLVTAPKVNAYGVIPVFFHTDCNHSGQHGTVLVSNRKLNLKNAVVAFFLKNHATAPAFTPKLFLELEAAAESQGFILHELISYDRIVSASSAQVGVSAEKQSMIDRQLQAQCAPTPAPVHHPLQTGSTFLGTLHHGESTASAGETLLRNAARTEGRTTPFDMHQLNDVNVPAFLRKEAAAVAASSNQPVDVNQERVKFINSRSIGWLLSTDEIDAKLSDWPEELREELKTAAALTFSNEVHRGSTHAGIMRGLSHVLETYTQRAGVAAMEVR